MFNKNIKEVTAGYFGKLPEFNDFVKFNAGAPEILFIDNWLQEGLAHIKLKYKSSWKDKYENLAPTRFFIPVPSSGRIVSGMLYASKDKSGRDFPFIIFSVIPAGQLNEFYLLPSALEQMIIMLDFYLRKEEQLASLNDTLKNVNLNPADNHSLKSDFLQYLTGTRMNEFLLRTKLDHSMLNINEIAFTESMYIKLSFISDDSHFFNDAGFLIYLLNKKINMNERQSSIFWTIDGGEQFRLLIFPFKLLPLNFADLISLENEEDRSLELKSREENTDNESFENGISLEGYLKSF